LIIVGYFFISHYCEHTGADGKSSSGNVNVGLNGRLYCGYSEMKILLNCKNLDKGIEIFTVI